MVGTAVRVHCMQTYCAFHDVFVLFNVVPTPFAQVMINLWTGPLFAATVKLTRMKPAVAVVAMLRNDTGHLAGTKRTIDCTAWYIAFCFRYGFPLIVHQRSWIVSGGTGHHAPRVRSSLVDGLSQSFHFSSNLRESVGREVCVGIDLLLQDFDRADHRGNLCRNDRHVFCTCGASRFDLITNSVLAIS